MTTRVDDDFREFVAARWGELEPVALLVTLDPAGARRATTDALAGLHGRWRELLDDGMPGASARGAVLTAALAAARAGGPPPPPVAAPSGAPLDDPDPAVAALLEAVRGATALERAVLAASSTWGVDAGGVAHLAELPAATVRDAERAVRRRLLEAHTHARLQQGLDPAEWAVDRDLAEALDALLAGVTDPPDAVALVGEQHRRVRRRTVVLGTGGALAAGAVGAFVLDAVASGAASEAAPLPPRPGDPVWTSTRSWPPRGALAADPGVVALVDGASPRARLLYADDVAGRRVVVATTADTSGAVGTVVRLWAGPRGAAPATLTTVDLARDRVTFLDDVVPLAVDAGPDDEPGAGAVVLLARPTVLEAEYSPLVRYSAAGDVGRRWDVQPLDDGVAVITTDGPLPPTFRVRLDGYDGAPLGAGPLGLPAPDRATPLARGLLDALGPFVAACTGLPVSALRSTVAREARVPGDVLVPAGPGERVGRGRAVVALTRLPDGALLRTVRVAGDGRGAVGPVDVETTRAVAPEVAAAPVAARLPSFGDTVGRFLVLAPGASRAQLVASTTDTYPASEVTPLREGAGVLEVADARRAPAYRLVTWDASGRRLGAWEQVFRRRDPRDLWPRVR